MTTKLKAGTLFADRYEILECLGRGGMGTVYSAQHCALAKKFAIKLLHRDLCANNKNALKRFAQEARASSGIEHQNIIDVLDAGSINGIAFYVMEHLNGEDLQTMFNRESPLPWERVQRIIMQICDAMQAAHDRRIIHRDLKPSNLYRITRGNNTDFIKILDFGIAKVRPADDNTRDGLTAVGSVLGTPKYMAPEQAMGLKIDHRADIYSLGVIMYHALTGETPFKRMQDAGRVIHGAGDEPTPMREYLDGIPSGVENLVLKALARDRSERFPSMRAMASAIERLRAPDRAEPNRVNHSRGPWIELDESSIELVSENPFAASTVDITTLVHQPKTRRADIDDAPGSLKQALPQSRPRRLALKIPAHTTDQIATQTSGPRRRKPGWQALTPWLPGFAVGGFMLLPRIQEGMEPNLPPSAQGVPEPASSKADPPGPKANEPVAPLLLPSKKELPKSETVTPIGLVLRPGRTDLIELEYDASALLRESPVNLPATAMSVRVPAGRPAPKFGKGTNPLAAEALA